MCPACLGLPGYSAACFCDSTTALVTVLLGTPIPQCPLPHMCAVLHQAKAQVLLSPEKHQQPQRSLQAEELWWAKVWLESLCCSP